MFFAIKGELHALPFLTVWTVSISRRENLSNKLILMRSSITSTSERISTLFSFHNGFSVNSLLTQTTKKKYGTRHFFLSYQIAITKNL